jgi:hypothetical protein
MHRLYCRSYRLKPSLFRAVFLVSMGLAASSAALANELNILSAWYGQSCGTAPGNVTSHVKAACDRKPTCQYGVDVNALGDSAPGCRKNFVVLYGCAGQASVRLAQLPAEASGASVNLSCQAGENRR